jgi:tRNA A37 threonylcarbamoyladenosine biosynthesis protein TsaE
MEANMPRTINDPYLREFRLILSGSQTRQPSDLLSPEFQQVLLDRYAPGLSLDSLLPVEDLKKTGSFRMDRRDSDSRSHFFHLFRYTVLQSVCETEDCEQIAGAFVVCYLCCLDRPFDLYDSYRTEQRFSSLLDQELQTFMIELGKIVDKEINPHLPDRYRLRFPHMDTLVFRGFSKTSNGKYRKIFMRTLRLNLDIARTATKPSRPEPSPIPSFRKNPEIKTVTTTDSDPSQLEIIRRSTVRRYGDLPAPAYQQAWGIAFARWFDQPVSPVYPFFQILGRSSPVTVLPPSLSITSTLHPVSLEPTTLSTENNITVSIADLSVGQPPYNRTMILGEVGSGRTTLVRQLGTMLGSNRLDGNSPSFLIYIDCENPAHHWLQQSPYDAAAEMLLTQDHSLSDSQMGLASLIEWWSESGRVLWVLDHLLEGEHGKMPKFLHIWSKFLGSNTRIILVPESQNRDFLEELITAFFPIPSILNLQPLSPEEQQAFISRYVETAVQGYLPGGEIRTFADGLVEEEEKQIKSSSSIMPDILKIRSAAESTRTEILQAASRLQTLSTRHIPDSVSLGTPLAALSYCMGVEMGKWDDNNRYLLLLFMERYGLLNHSYDQPLMFPLDKAAEKASTIKCALGKIALGLAGKPKVGTKNGELFTQAELEHWLSPIPGIEISQMQDNLIHTRIIKRSFFNQEVFQFTYPSFQTIIAGEYSRYIKWQC